MRFTTSNTPQAMWRGSLYMYTWLTTNKYPRCSKAAFDMLSTTVLQSCQLQNSIALTFKNPETEMGKKHGGLLILVSL